ncbi:hypothetical protein B0H19DRAFT_1233761 [Mycena capillaripes]|nr:hypothetical protein B0H19DRAFT_1233761 [Mycena capillaripes]
MSQQLRDAQATIESLRTQITILQGRTHDVERARDRAEMELQFYGGGHETKHRVSRWDAHPDLVRVDGKIRRERKFADGGAYTVWDSAPSDDEAEKENKHPSSSSSYGFPTPPALEFDLHGSSSPPPPHRLDEPTVHQASNNVAGPSTGGDGFAGIQ